MEEERMDAPLEELKAGYECALARYIEAEGKLVCARFPPDSAFARLRAIDADDGPSVSPEVVRVLQFNAIVEGLVNVFGKDKAVFLLARHIVGITL
jgi:hypothetical protein